MTSVTQSLLMLVESNRIFVGNIENGSVQAKRVVWSLAAWEAGGDDDTPSHHELGLHHGKRWRFPEDSNTVFWWESPTEADKIAVDDYLEKRGFGDKLRHLLLGPPNGVVTDRVRNTSDYAHGIADKTPNRFRAKGRVKQHTSN